MEFSLRGAHTGDTSVTVAASSSASQPEASTGVVVYLYGRSTLAVVLASGLFLLLPAAVLALALRPGARRGPEGKPS